jgi:hypothetical protein
MGISSCGYLKVECLYLAYNGFMATAKKTKDLSSWIPGWMASEDSGVKSACLHFFTDEASGLKAGDPFEVLTTAMRKKDGSLALKEFRISPLGSHGIDVPAKGDVVPNGSKRAWVGEIFETLAKKGEIDPKFLQEYLATAVLRKVLTGHIIALHYEAILRQRQLNNSLKSGIKEKTGKSFANKGESVTRATARIYEDLIGWGESKAAAVIAEAEGVTPTTIHNRLQLARSGGYLDTPGRGSRG